MNNSPSNLQFAYNLLNANLTENLASPSEDILVLNKDISELFEATMPNGIIAVNSAGIILSFNRKAGEIFGYSPEEAIGKNIGDLILLEYPDKLESCIINFLKLDSEIKFLEKLCEASKEYEDGPIVPVKFSVGKTNFDDRLLVTLSVQYIGRQKLEPANEKWLVEKLVEVDQLIVKKGADLEDHHHLLKKEIDKRKHVEDKLRLSQAMNSIDARFIKAGRLAEQIARDFNNLLVPLQTFPKLLKSKLQQDNEWFTYCDSMEKVAHRLTQVNDQLLALMSFNRQENIVFDVNMVLTEATNLVQDFLKQDLSIESEIPQDSFTLRGRPEQLYRVFFNLLLNAKDAINGDKGTIKVACEKVILISDSTQKDPFFNTEYAKIRISDNGAGIPRENLGKIFDPFYTTKNDPKQKGAGLGLTVVKDMIRDHKGFIEVDSVVGQGTAFSIHLPLTSEE